MCMLYFTSVHVMLRANQIRKGSFRATIQKYVENRLKTGVSDFQIDLLTTQFELVLVCKASLMYLI